MGNAFYTLMRTSKPICNIRDIPVTLARKTAIEYSKSYGSTFFKDIINGNIPLKDIHIYFDESKQPLLILPELFSYYERWYEKTKNGTKSWARNTFAKEIGKSSYFISYPERRVNGISTTVYKFKDPKTFETVRVFIEDTISNKPIFRTLSEHINKVKF